MNWSDKEVAADSSLMVNHGEITVPTVDGDVWLRELGSKPAFGEAIKPGSYRSPTKEILTSYADRISCSTPKTRVSRFRYRAGNTLTDLSFSTSTTSRDPDRGASHSQRGRKGILGLLYRLASGTIQQSQGHICHILTHLTIQLPGGCS